MMRGPLLPNLLMVAGTAQQGTWTERMSSLFWLGWRLTSEAAPAMWEMVMLSPSWDVFWTWP